MTRNVSIVVLMLALALQAGCASSKNTRKPEAKALEVHPQVNYRPLKIPAPLNIALAESVSDEFFTSGPFGDIRTVGLRETLQKAIVESFQNNFTEVKVVASPPDRGFALLIQRAEMQRTITMKYYAIFTFDGKEVVDLIGETKGRTVFGDMFTIGRAIKQLQTEAYSKTCEALYDSVFHSEKTEALLQEASQRPAAPAAPSVSSTDT